MLVTQHVYAFDMILKISTNYSYPQVYWLVFLNETATCLM